MECRSTVLLSNAVEPYASDVISEAWFTLRPIFWLKYGSKMLASKSWHFLSHFQSENGNKYSRWPIKEVYPRSDMRSSYCGLAAFAVRSSAIVDCIQNHHAVVRSCGWLLVRPSMDGIITAICVTLMDSQPFCSRANRANRPIKPWPIRSLELSLPGPFVPWSIRSLALSLFGTYASRSKNINGPGTFVLLVHTRYSNYALLLMQTFSTEHCGTHGLSETLDT